MRNHANIKVNIYLHFMASKSLKNFTDVLNFTSISCKWFRLPFGKNGKNLRLITQKHTIKICIPNILQVFLHNVHEEFDLFVFWVFLSIQYQQSWFCRPKSYAVPDKPDVVERVTSPLRNIEIQTDPRHERQTTEVRSLNRSESQYINIYHTY